MSMFKLELPNESTNQSLNVQVIKARIYHARFQSTFLTTKCNSHAQSPFFNPLFSSYIGTASVPEGKFCAWASLATASNMSTNPWGGALNMAFVFSMQSEGSNLLLPDVAVSHTAEHEFPIRDNAIGRKPSSIQEA